MRTHFLRHPHGKQKEDTPPCVLALGYFDGVHIGHQKVISTARKIAGEKGIATAVMTFHPHPAVVLGKQKEPRYLTPLPQKIQLFASLGVDHLYIVTFDKTFAALSPQQFIDQYVVGLGARHVVAGFDFTFGHRGSGNMQEMDHYARGRFGQTTVKKVEKNGEKISSSSIREQIAAGKTEEACAYLGRYYEICGQVVRGEQRGREIGFPTANIDCHDAYLLPAPGVYAVRMNVRGKWHKGVASIGFKPTFHERLTEAVIEVFLLNFTGDLYGEDVSVEWRKKIRDEKKFSSVEALVREMKKDVARAKDYFAAKKNENLHYKRKS